MKQIISMRTLGAIFILSALTALASATYVRDWQALGTTTGSVSFKDIAVDSSGNVYCVGSRHSTLATNPCVTKFDKNGTFISTVTINGQGQFHDVVLDGSGRLYAAGILEGKYAIAKYETSNLLLSSTWSSTGSGPGVRTYRPAGVTSPASAYALAYDAVSQDVVATGVVLSAPSNQDIATIRIDGPTGAFAAIWPDNGAGVGVRVFSGPGVGNDQGVDVVFDSTGRVIVCGGSNGTGSGFDFLAIKYDSTGALSSTWANVGQGVGVRRFSDTGNGSDFPYDMAIDGSDSIYLTGTGNGTTTTNEEVLTVKYTVAGNLAWSSRYDQEPGGNEQGSACAVRGTEVAVTGFTTAGAITMSLNAATGIANPSWANNGFGVGIRMFTAGDSQAGNAITFDTGGRILVAGNAFKDGEMQALLLEYGAAGTLDFIDFREGGSSATAIVIDANSQVYSAGSFGSAGLAVKYNIPNVTGRIRLDSFTGDRTQVPVLIELRTPGSLVAQEFHTVYPIDQNGNYRFRTTMTGTFDIAAKPSHWLRDVRESVSVLASGATGVSYTCMNGDVDGDNEVTLVDHSMIALAFGTSEGDANFSSSVDLDGDLEVTLADVGILALRFGLLGED